MDQGLAVKAELDALLDVLRQPARPDELAGEQEAVAAMAAPDFNDNFIVALLDFC